MTLARARLPLLLLVALPALGWFAQGCWHYLEAANFHDYGYFIYQSAILDRFGSPWDPAARTAAEPFLNFPHTISVAHYFPSFFALLIPLSRLEYAASARLWCFVSLAALFFTLVALWRWFFRGNRPREGALLLVIMLGLFYPLRFNIGTGQNNLLTLGFIMLGVELLVRRRPALAGFPLALAALCKIVPLVLLAPLVLRREWRGLTSMLVWFLALNLLTLAWLPPSAFVDFSRAVAYKMQTDAHCILSFSVHALAWRLTGSKAVAGLVQNAVFLSVVLAAAWLTWRRPALGWPHLMALWSLVMLVGSAFLGEAHLVFALPALMASCALLFRAGTGPAWLETLPWLAAALLLGAKYHLDGFRFVYTWPFVALLNCKLYGLLLLLALYIRQLIAVR